MIWYHFVTTFVTYKAPYTTNSILKQRFKKRTQAKERRIFEFNIGNKIKSSPYLDGMTMDNVPKVSHERQNSLHIRDSVYPRDVFGFVDLFLIIV